MCGHVMCVVMCGHVMCVVMCGCTATCTCICIWKDVVYALCRDGWMSFSMQAQRPN